MAGVHVHMDAHGFPVLVPLMTAHCSPVPVLQELENHGSLHSVGAIKPLPSFCVTCTKWFRCFFCLVYCFFFVLHLSS